MSAVAAWIMCILAIVVLGIILDLLLSETRMHKLIQTVFATVTILVIITPIPSLIKSGFGTNGKNIFDGSIELDSGYLEYTNRVMTAAMEKGLVEALAGDGIKNVSVSIRAEFGEEIVIKEVSINLKDLVIDKNYLHINKYEYVRDKVSSYLKIQKGIVLVYE